MTSPDWTAESVIPGVRCSPLQGTEDRVKPLPQLVLQQFPAGEGELVPLPSDGRGH